jgi:hypothetical protein
VPTSPVSGSSRFSGEHRREGDRRVSQQDSIFGVKSSYEYKRKEGVHQSYRSERQGWRSVDMVPFRMIGDTRMECRYASSQRKSTRFGPTGSNRHGAQPGSPARFGWRWTDFCRGSQTRRVRWQRRPRWFIQCSNWREFLAPAPTRNLYWVGARVSAPFSSRWRCLPSRASWMVR